MQSLPKSDADRIAALQAVQQRVYNLSIARRATVDRVHDTTVDLDGARRELVELMDGICTAGVAV